MPDDPTTGAPDESPQRFPEVTRSLRVLGSGRSRRASEEARFFAPLLAARRAAADARTRADAIAAFDARRLRAAMDALLRAFASERHPERSSARRALQAELEDLAAPLYRALVALAEATPSRAAAAPGDVPDQGWDRWLAAVRALFEGADAAWRELDACLDAVPIAPEPKGKRRGARAARPKNTTEER